ncbi:MAG: GFA family protein [Colwellia sp.]|nr:GFA family protein [Colwellia sp.]MCW8864597.1 GFA family protein [Colwellia sp.]MCW9081537.1 GFA family protein [Colwellia sp.]
MNIQKNNCEGGCACGYVRYCITAKPLITHCCHCRYCQRQTGTAFALNALFEASHVEIITGSVDELMTDSPSGRGQKIARCPKCEVALWSNYFMGGIKDMIRFIRVGTLDNPDQFPPDVHIYTESKQPWVKLATDDAIFTKFYEFEKTWTAENENRRKSLLASAQNENSND